MPRSRRRAWVAGGALVAALGWVAAAACLPSIQFETPTGDAGDGSVAGEAGSDAGDVSSPDAKTPVTDGGIDGDADASGNDADASPSPLGPFAVDKFDTYLQGAVCAVYQGTLYCWGGAMSNLAGQLGLPPQGEDSGTGYLVPTAVPSTAQPPTQITQISMGSLHTCTLYGRTAYCRGDNDDGELGNAASDGGAVEVPVEGLPAGGLDSIATADFATCGITLLPDAGSPSNVYCWGTNGEGELGRAYDPGQVIAAPVTGVIDGGPTGAIPDAVAIAGGGDHFCALTQAGQILCWGGTQFYESGPLQGSTDCPGGNETTCLEQPQPVTLPSGEVPVAIALGEYVSCALAASGSVYCWGWDFQNAFGAGSTAIAQTCTTADNDTAPCTGTPVKVANLSDAKVLRSGGMTSCALDSVGHAYCWGNNSDGELGQTGTQPQTAPVEVVDPLTGEPYTFDDVAIGDEMVCGRSAGAMYCWGGGAIGDGKPESAPQTPTAVQF